MTKTQTQKPRRGRPLTIRNFNFGKNPFSAKSLVKRYGVTQSAANIAIHRNIDSGLLKAVKRVVEKGNRKPTYHYQLRRK